MNICTPENNLLYGSRLFPFLGSLSKVYVFHMRFGKLIVLGILIFLQYYLI